METVKVELELPKEATTLAMGMATFAGVVMNALKDGFKPGDDIPVVVAAAIADLSPALTGIGQLADEIKGDKAIFVAAFAYAGLQFFETLNKKV